MEQHKSEGRPRKTYVDCIKDYMKILGLSQEDIQSKSK